MYSIYIHNINCLYYLQQFLLMMLLQLMSYLHVCVASVEVQLALQANRQQTCTYVCNLLSTIHTGILLSVTHIIAIISATNIHMYNIYVKQYVTTVSNSTKQKEFINLLIFILWLRYHIQTCSIMQDLIRLAVNFYIITDFCWRKRIRFHWLSRYYCYRWPRIYIRTTSYTCMCIYLHNSSMIIQLTNIMGMALVIKCIIENLSKKAKIRLHKLLASLQNAF